MMLTFRAGKFAALIVLVALLSACSREQQDWRSAEATDTVEGYGEFLHRHPDSELATEARTRVEQLSEDREWQSVGAADTADAYKQFLAQHPNGKWAQEARIRVENFALGREGAPAAPGVSAAVTAQGAGDSSGSAASAASGLGAGSTASGAYGSAGGSASSPIVGSAWTGSSSGTAQAFPGEAARAAASAGDPARSSPPTATANAPTPTQLASSAPVSPGDLARPLAPAQVPPAASGGAPAQISPAGSADASPAIAGAWRSDDGFGVQLGAFASENAATTEWQQLTTRFSAQLRGLAPRVISANTSTGRLFRLQALVADEAAARTLCDMLRKQSQACVPVLPH